MDGGYAYVIRAEDYPVPPVDRGRRANTAPPRNPARPPSEDPEAVYVYRDTSGQQTNPAEPDESDAAYWYGRREEEASPAREETRGCFEPLISSAAPPQGPPSQGPPSPDPPPGPEPGPEPGPGAADDGLNDPAHAHERKLEQIKDFYLTAEAIGEENVDKHFDQLLAQQRELISEYFRQSAASAPVQSAPVQSAPVTPAAQPGPAPDEPGQDPVAQVRPPGAFVAGKPRA